MKAFYLNSRLPPAKELLGFSLLPSFILLLIIGEEISFFNPHMLLSSIFLEGIV